MLGNTRPALGESFLVVFCFNYADVFGKVDYFSLVGSLPGESLSMGLVYSRSRSE